MSARSQGYLRGRRQTCCPVKKKMAWSVVGMLAAAICCQAMAQLDIIGHKQLRQIPADTPSGGGGGVKTKKQFAVYDAVAVVKRNLTGAEITNNSVDSVLSDGASANVTMDGDRDGEMVSYSTKFSVSLKNNKEEERIDRNSYQYPISYPVGHQQHQQPGGVGGGGIGGLGGGVGGYLGGGGSPGYLNPSYLQYPPLTENLTPQISPHQVRGQLGGQQYPGSQPGYYQHHQPPQYSQYHQYSPTYHSPPYQSYHAPAPATGSEYRQSLPYGELYPSQDYLFSPQHSQDYLAAPLQYDDTDITEPPAEITAKSEQKQGKHAEKRGLGLGGLGPIGGPLGIPPHAGGYLGPIGGYGGPIGGLRPGGLLRPGLHHRIPHHVPVPVPVHVPIVRTFHTKHLNQHDHLHKHKNTHSHKVRQN